MYDKTGEEHYNLISALHKSVRTPTPTPRSTGWVACSRREDPLYLARRIVRMAIEDIGLAAPEAMNLCLSARDTYQFLGSPEGDLALAQAVVYLCSRPSPTPFIRLRRSTARHRADRQEPVPSTCATPQPA